MEPIITIRRYTNEDKARLIHLFQLNTPKYFDPTEESDFRYYLENYIENYFVVEREGIIIGSGGINYPRGPAEGLIAWDMIHPNYHRQGIGRQLTQYRIDRIKENPKVEVITVRTSQLAYAFYQKFGFELEKIEKDFWAEGLDLYEMRLRLH